MFVLLFLLWILLSGHVSWVICIFGIVLSILLYFFFRSVLPGDQNQQKPTLQRLWKTLCYLAFLWWEILKAGYTVMKIIYTRGSNTKPVLVYFNAGMKSDKARAALANSITLTAGTITVSMENDKFCVHALDQSLAEEIESCEFVKRLKKMER